MIGKRKMVMLLSATILMAEIGGKNSVFANEAESVSTNQVETEEMQQKIVRVAFPTQEGMSYIGHSGKVTGYNYDYLEKISEYTGWEMEYVLYPSDDGNEAVGNAINDLTEGKVDLLGPLLKNEQTEEMFAFPDHSYGTVYTTLCALSSNGLRENNLKQQEKLKIGLWEKAEVRNSEVLTFLESENIDAEIIYYPSAEEQHQALVDGEVDAISSVSLSPVANTRIVAQFAARQYYFAAPKGEEDLIEQLDESIEKINSSEVNLQDTLYDKYFRQSEDVFVLSEEQKKQLAEQKELEVLCVSDDAPYVFQRNGEATGMLISVLNDYVEQTGLSVQYTFCDNRDEAIEAIKEKTYDIFIGGMLSSKECAKLGYINSVPVFEATLAYANASSGAKGKRLVMVDGMQDQIDTSEYTSVQYYDSMQDCIQAVDDGKADIVAGDRSSMSYYINDCGSLLVTSLMPGQMQNINIAVSRQTSDTLLKTLNNYIYSISESDLANYFSDGNIHSNSFSIFLYIKRNPVQASLAIIVLTLLVAFIIFLILNKSSREQAEMQKMHNKQLQEALQIAQEANASKTTFLSNMSHDIRTPMNAVIGFSTLLAREPEDSVKVKEYARKITAASNHLLGLINDILDISKIESGKISLRQSVFSMDELLESINVVIRPMAGAKHQSFNVHIGEMNHELFVGDKVRVNQVLINLLSNAVKYTPMDGHIEFNIKDVKDTSALVSNVQFQVKDDGYGIAEEFQKIIFEPFTRAENSTTNKEVGTGLGLAITKNVIDLMGGTIDLDSTLGKGTTFTVELPLRIPVEEQDEAFWEKHGITRILLVDDDKTVCDTVQSYMKETGVICDAVYSGEEAVARIRKMNESKEAYSAIILDWQMPGMNGLDTAREIRKMIPIDTPVLFLTSYDWTDIETEALEIDVDGFMAKPFTVINLKEKLMEVEHFKNAVAKPDVEIDLKDMHFLLAEDNQLNAEIMVEILKSEGATCDVVENGKIAVETFTSKPAHTYDAILMDIMMPVLNGYDATRQIRASRHPEALSIPIVAMTANAFVKDVQDALDAGMNAHIAKPINLETLKSTLGWCIKK